MKILHLIDTLKVGGAQTHLRTMIQEMKKAFPDVEHKVFALFDDGPVGEQLRSDGYSVQALDQINNIRKLKLKTIISRIQQEIKEYSPDVFESHLSYSRIIGGYVALWEKVKVRVGFEQGDLYLCSPFWRCQNFLSQFSYNNVIVCSHWLKEWVVKTHAVAPKKIHVYHNAVNFDKFSRKEVIKRGAPEGLEKGEQSTKFIAVGTLGKGINKKVDVCIRGLECCLRQGGDAVLIVVGDGEKRDGLEQLAKELGVKDKVKFLGARTDVPEIMSSCQCFVHGADREPFGIVAVEAMGMELPVIAPAGGGIQEIIEDGKTGYLYPPNDYETLGRKMKGICDDTILAATMGKEARRKAEEKFSIENYVQRLHKQYQDLLIRKGRKN